MTKVKALVITGYGTNCEKESAHAALQAGADAADIIYFSDLVAGRSRLDGYDFLIFPGGFLDGDDLGAAQAAALRWQFQKDGNGDPLVSQLKNFIESGGVALGICNGFQLMVKLGLLPALGGKYFERTVTLSLNDSAKFEDRWVRLKANPDSPCVFTKGIDLIDMPIRHGEGKLIPMDEATLAAMEKENLVALQYAHPETGEVTQEYPFNPNGSPLAAAGLTDPSGRMFGLMPHPEAFNHKTNHPGWTRDEETLLGTAVMVNAVEYLKGR